jgi:transposase
VDVQAARVQALLADGLSIRDIAEKTGIPRSTVHRIKRRGWSGTRRRAPWRRKKTRKNNSGRRVSPSHPLAHPKKWDAF